MTSPTLNSYYNLPAAMENSLSYLYEQNSDQELDTTMRQVCAMAAERGGENYDAADVLLALRDFAMLSEHALPFTVPINEFKRTQSKILKLSAYALGRLEQATKSPEIYNFDLYTKLLCGAIRKSGTIRGADYVDMIVETGILEFEGNVGEYGNIGLKELGQRTVELSEKLRDAVVGQNHAISSFVEGYFRGRMRSALAVKKKGPRATFLFAGPPGVGKSFVAEKAAEIMGIPCRRFDMTAYADEKAYIDLIGSSNRFNYADKGDLTSFVQLNPCSILIIDEVEKSHITSLNLFLQVLDTGRLYDQNLAMNVDFDNTIIIFTTNAGSSIYDDEQRGDLEEVPADVIYNAIIQEKNYNNKPILPITLMSRLRKGNIIMFNRITAAGLIDIVEKGVDEIRRRLKAEQDIQITCDNLLPATLLFANSALDARGAAGIGEKFVMSELYELIRLATADKEGFDSECRHFRFCLDIDHADEEIKRIYQPEGHRDIIVFCDRRGKNVNFESLGDRLHLVQDMTELKAVLEKAEHAVALVEYLAFPRDGAEEKLNLEDAETEGRKAFDYLRREYPEVPLYTWVDGRTVNSEEIFSLSARGSVHTYVTDHSGSEQGDPEYLVRVLQKIVRDVNYERALMDLQMRHKVLCFETDQKLDRRHMRADIRLYDFHLRQSVDMGDTADLILAGESNALHWDDIIVSDDVREELGYAVDYLTNAENYAAKKTNWAVVPRGMIMYGPPGTGKTSIAKALATEAGVNFIACSADRFASSYMENGPKEIRQVFKRARKYAPCVLFIDEIDAIGRNREESIQTSAVTLNSLLTELDGFSTSRSKPVFVVAATNLGGDNRDSGLLDPALIRRFDRSIRVDLPDKENRIKYLKLLKKNMKQLQISQEMVENLADRSVAMSFATIRLAVDTAVRMAIRAGSVVTDEIMDEAFEKFNNGERKQPIKSEIESVAVHEAGHALVSNYYGWKPSYLTIVSREGFLGYMSFGDNEEKPCRTKEDYLHRISIVLAGRAAELIKSGEGTGTNAGAASDLEQATALAESMVKRLGMYDDMGLRVISMKTVVSEETAKGIDEKINAILSQQMDDAKRILTEESEKLDRLSAELIRKQHLNEKQIQEIL